jgi:hypothetical protein
MTVFSYPFLYSIIGILFSGSVSVVLAKFREGLLLGTHGNNM